MEIARDDTTIQRKRTRCLSYNDSTTILSDEVTLPWKTVYASAVDGEHAEVKAGYLASYFDHGSNIWRVALVHFQWLNSESKHVA